MLQVNDYIEFAKTDIGPVCAKNYSHTTTKLFSSHERKCQNGVKTTVRSHLL